MIDFVSSLKSAQEKLGLKNGAMRPEMNPHGVQIISSISMLVVADVESSEDRGSGAALAFLLGFSAPPLRPFWCKKVSELGHSCAAHSGIVAHFSVRGDEENSRLLNCKMRRARTQSNKSLIRHKGAGGGNGTISLFSNVRWGYVGLPVWRWKETGHSSNKATRVFETSLSRRVRTRLGCCVSQNDWKHQNST